MSRVRHAHTLRAPWYVLERGKLDRSDPAARRPALQKYDRADFVHQVLADPRVSLAFGADDVWTFAVPRPPKLAELGRAGFATHRLLRTGMRKLYQPNHDRFYAAVAELFCDAPGLPMPGRAAGVEVRFVVRRERITIAEGDAAEKALRKLAPALAVRLDRAQHAWPEDQSATHVVAQDDMEDLVWVERGNPFPPDQQALLDTVAPRSVEEAWVGDGERGRWVAVPPRDPKAPPELLEGEHEREMWPVPVPADACARARKRSLWFAPVPTLSGLHDTATGLPQFDDRATYRILCFARTLPEHRSCPARLGWADPSEPFRLAGFFDPAGTRNHRVTVVAPDFRALAARAGEPPGPGGLELVQPPGSQLRFGSSPDGRPVDAEPGEFGTATMRCTVAVELLMIVAMFLFSLFLPVVALLFQLWWLLLLRFCLPRPELAFSLLSTHFAAGRTVADLPAAPATPPTSPPTVPDRGMLDELLDTPGLADHLAAPGSGFPPAGASAGGLVDGAPKDRPPDAPRTPEEVRPDPLCPLPP